MASLINYKTQNRLVKRQYCKLLQLWQQMTAITT